MRLVLKVDQQNSAAFCGLPLHARANHLSAKIPGLRPATSGHTLDASLSARASGAATPSNPTHPIRPSSRRTIALPFGTSSNYPVAAVAYHRAYIFCAHWKGRRTGRMTRGPGPAGGPKVVFCPQDFGNMFTGPIGGTVPSSMAGEKKRHHLPHRLRTRHPARGD